MSECGQANQLLCDWASAVAMARMLPLAAQAAWRDEERRVHLRRACVSVGVLVACGMAVIWTRSAMVGAEPIPRAAAMTFEGRVLERIEQPAAARVRLVLATRDP